MASTKTTSAMIRREVIWAGSEVVVEETEGTGAEIEIGGMTTEDLGEGTSIVGKMGEMVVETGEIVIETVGMVHLETEIGVTMIVTTDVKDQEAEITDKAVTEIETGGAEKTIVMRAGMVDSIGVTTGPDHLVMKEEIEDLVLHLTARDRKQTVKKAQKAIDRHQPREGL